jgi:hypothetical protein
MAALARRLRARRAPVLMPASGERLDLLSRRFGSGARP